MSLLKWLVLPIVAATLVCGLRTTSAQGIVPVAGTGYGTQQAVGGVWINAQGMLGNQAPADAVKMRQDREKALNEVPGDLKKPSKQRMISLRRLQETIDAARVANKPLTDEIRYLAGLQRVEYVFAVPDQKDIILAGPAEGWKLNAEGNLVGVQSGHPVLQLDDLLVALRSVQSAARETISCSIDATPEGNKRYEAFMKRQPKRADQTVIIPEMERELGMSVISVTGVPNTSHFAQVLVSADYRMKRLGMNLDPSPVKGLTSYLEMIKSSSAAVNMHPRWWMAPMYDPLLKDADGLSWQLKGQGVKTVAQEDLFNADGQREKTVKASPIAEKWAENMTSHFEELAQRETVFGELRNCMDLAVIATLITKERLLDKTGLQLPLLLNAKQLVVSEYQVPKQVESKVSFIHLGQRILFGTSGGVQIQPVSIVSQVKESADLAPVRTKSLAEKNTKWWWD